MNMDKERGERREEKEEKKMTMMLANITICGRDCSRTPLIDIMDP
jgi:hypothetical protein